jgi:hypothetical protein
MAWSFCNECIDVWCSSYVLNVLVGVNLQPQPSHIAIGIDYEILHTFRVHRTSYNVGLVHHRTLSDCCCR